LKASVRLAAAETVICCAVAGNGRRNAKARLASRVVFVAGSGKAGEAG